MKPIRQTIHLVDPNHNTVFVISGKGNIYHVDMNHYCKDIKPGDVAIVTKSINGDWLLVDVENKYPNAQPLDVTDFPRDEHNCLNMVEYWKYRKQFDQLKTDSKRNEMNTFLLNLFVTKYGMKSLAMKYQLDIEPQATLEEYV